MLVGEGCWLGVCVRDEDVEDAADEVIFIEQSHASQHRHPRDEVQLVPFVVVFFGFCFGLGK